MTFLRTFKPGMLLIVLALYVLLMVGMRKLGWFTGGDRPIGAGVDFIIDSAIGIFMGWTLRSWEEKL